MRITVLFSVALIFPPFISSTSASTLNRDSDPVVVIGAELPSYLGSDPEDLVAFRFDVSWTQIPVQVDEKNYVDFGVAYNSTPVGLGVVAYADPLTYTGGDTNPTFDSDDELVFMASDAGVKALLQAELPSGVFETSGLELRLDDPLDGGSGYVYLFKTDGSLSQDAGQDYVTYDFNLLAGPYIPNYSTLSGPNPEDSLVESDHYRTHFSDRWVRDSVQVLAGSSTGADIFDRHKPMFAPGNCQRTEDTFSGGEGAFFVNKDGAVRALRSYMGANSGPFTQRVHRFYRKRQEITTHLRVHAIGSIADLYDYSPAATGMTYYNDLNLTGHSVDGDPEIANTGSISWELITGSQGSLICASSFFTDIPGFSYTSYYSDDSTPSFRQCTGDDFEYATSGPFVNQPIPNTDPYLGNEYLFVGTRVVAYATPGQTPASAYLLSDQVGTPLTVTINPYIPQQLPKKILKLRPNL